MHKFEHMHVLIFVNKIARRHQLILRIKNIKVTTKFIVKKTSSILHCICATYQLDGMHKIQYTGY